MKVKLEFEFDLRQPPHFFCRTFAGNQYVVASGHSWTEAREEMLARLRKIKHADVPEPEEIEID